MLIPDELKIEFDRKRRASEDEQQRRKEEVYAKIPEIEDIDSKMRMTAFSLGELAFNKDISMETAREKVDVELKRLKEQKEALLLSHGLPADYLEIHYSCPVCHDTGYIDVSRTVMCKCLKSRMLEFRYATSNIENGEYFSTFDLSVFKDEKSKRVMSKLYDYAINYANTLPAPTPINLILSGPTGIGKSFVLNCIAHRALERGLNVHKVTAYNLIDSVLRSMKSSEPTPDYASYDFLAIDDLGSEPMIKNITIERLFAIINERESLNKPTAIATNLSLSDLAVRYEERIFSRLVSKKYSKFIVLDGDDIRLGK